MPCRRLFATAIPSYFPRDLGNRVVCPEVKQGSADAPTYGTLSLYRQLAATRMKWVYL